jgi:putative membrane protein
MLPSVSDLPLVNASLNGIATVLLIVGYVCIRRRRIAAHRAAMVTAFATSVLFLISYLIYHAHAGSRPFPGQGPIRVVYFAILITHIVLAATIPALAGVTLWRAYRRRFDRHKRIARWTLPLWLYVSITGIVVYWMLYQMY